MELSKKKQINRDKLGPPSMYTIESIMNICINVNPFSLYFDYTKQKCTFVDNDKLHPPLISINDIIKIFSNIDYIILINTYFMYKTIDGKSDSNSRKRKTISPSIESHSDEENSDEEQLALTKEDIENLQWVVAPKKHYRQSAYYDIVHPVDLPHIKMFRCKTCNKIQKSRATIAAHAHTHVPNFVYKYVCPFSKCDIKTGRIGEIRRHMECFHNGTNFITNDTSVNKSLWKK